MNSTKPFDLRCVSVLLAGMLWMSSNFVIWCFPPIANADSLDRQNNEKELFLVAQKAFEDGFYDVAMRYINQLLEEYPQSEKRIEANLLLGQCYFFKSQYLKAYDIFQNLLQFTEFKDATLFWLGETYLKGTDYKQAEKHYRQLIELYPQSVYTPQAYYSLGWVYFEQSEFIKAKKIFQKLIGHFPAHQLTEDASFKLGEAEYNLRNYEKTIKYFKDYVLKYPKSTRHAEAYFYIAESYYYLQDALTSITYYAKTADISYDHKLILMAKVSLGWSYLRLGKLNLAEKHFSEASQFAQDKGIQSDDVYLGQASLYSEMKEYEMALKAYNLLIEKFPNSQRIAEAYLGEANCYYLLMNYSKAIMAYQKIIDQFSPTTPEISGKVSAPSTARRFIDKNLQEILEKAYFGVAWAYLKAGNIDKSIKNFETIKDQTQSKIVKISALAQIGDAYQDVGQLEKAIKVYDAILTDYPDSPYTDYVQYRQGISLLKMDKIEAATLSFQSLQVNFPGSKYLSDIKYYLAVAYFKKEDWLEARDQIEEFIIDVPETHEFLAEANYILALSNFNLNEYEKAIKYFQKIIKNYPQNIAMIKNSEISIAKCYYKIGQTADSLNTFKIIINKYPESEVAQESLIWLGDHYLESSDFDEAIVYYQQFIKDFPGSDKFNLVQYNLGQAYQTKKEYDQAINVFKRIDDPKDRELYAKARLAIADIFSKELDPTSAIETYKNIISSSPEFKRDAYVKIAEVYKNNLDYTNTVEAYKNAIKSDTGFSQIKNAEIQFFIGDAYELLHQRDQAVEEYFKMPYLYKEDVAWVIKAYLRIARIFEDEEHWGEAKIIYSKIIDLDTEELKFAQERLEWIEENVIE